MNKPSVHAIVPCAGSGSRYDADGPKQYETLAGKPLVEHALAALLACEQVESVTVALADGDSRFSALPSASHEKLDHCIGGETRAESVLNGLLAIQSRVKPDSWVLVHDAARPLLSTQLLDRLIRAVQDHEVGGLLAVPLYDTVKQLTATSGSLGAGGATLVEKTCDRDELLAAQTPQVFRYHLLRNALSFTVKAGEHVTDEAAAIERLGYEPLAVEGCRTNLKITTATDMQLAEFYLQQDGSP